MESFALRLSVAGYAGMAEAGFVFAALTQSGAILLDRAYSLVSFAMVLLAVQGEVRRRVEAATADLAFPRSDVAELDEVRGSIAATLSDFETQTVLDIVFTGDERWILGLVEHDPPSDAADTAAQAGDSPQSSPADKESSTG